MEPLQTSPLPSNPGTPPGPKGVSWFLIILGLASIGVGCYAYFEFANWENEGGTIYQNAFLMLLYDIGGKWGPLLGMSLFGLLFIFIGTWPLFKKGNKL